MGIFVLEIYLDVKPVGKQRPRLCNGRVYTPEKTKNAERDIVLLVSNYMRSHGIQITNKPVSVELVFYFQDPKNKNEFFQLWRLYDKKPDLDNMAKTVLDALNNLLYYDDAQVCKLTCEKFYSPKQGIYLKVLEI